MKLSKRQLKRIIRNSLIAETDYSSMSENEIYNSLSDDDYAALEGLAYTLGDDLGDATMGPEEAGYIITVLLQKIFPMISNNPSLKKFVQ